MPESPVIGLTAAEIQAAMAELVVELFNSPRFSEVPTAVPIEDRGIVVGSTDVGWYLVKPRELATYLAAVVPRLLERNNQRVAEQLLVAGVSFPPLTSSAT
ncbi:MAG TPA: hypothetical protein QGG37_06885 [Chloroflexota bacterium]|nr:hypothetical protein [Chloroflexota bacterium]